MEAVGRLTGGIAHDFHNLLAIILSNAELVGKALSPEAVRAHEELNDLKASAERGAAMIRKLLGFSRNSELELREVDLRSLVGSMTGMLDRLLPANIEVRATVDDTVGFIRGDQGAIEQVLLNLATNARDAMPTGGRLHVEVGPQYLDADYCSSRPWVKQGKYACLSVCDSGVGMDHETQRRIFEPFFTTKPADAGTGLGMSMVYGLVKQHGGFVHVYSEPGHGTAVKVHFPEVGQISRPASRCVSYESEALAGAATILLTEDETALRRAAKRVLETQGYAVLAAADGEEALCALEAHPSEIDLVISDLVMPRLSGAELYKAVRQREPSVKFLMTSGFSVSEMQLRTSIDPAVPCLQKPWTVTELLWSVRDALEGGVDEAA
jgi:CheY-like chemotaxis protein